MRISSGREASVIERSFRSVCLSVRVKRREVKGLQCRRGTPKRIFFRINRDVEDLSFFFFFLMLDVWR